MHLKISNVYLKRCHFNDIPSHARRLFPLSGEFCEVGLRPPSPCQLAQCQNGAPCVEKTGTAVCQCLPGFEGQSCEKLVSVNFVDRDSYVQLQDIKNWPQANITLQVR